MIWHIFTKDVRLLWPFAIAVATSQAINGALHFLRGHLAPSINLMVISIVFPVISLLGIALLTLVVVQQDPLPGTRQDWLIRPIRRRDLLLAKLLFVLLLIHLPILALDTTEATLEGFPTIEALSAALSRQLSLFVLLTTPALVLGAVTRSAAEALLYGGVVAIGCGLLLVICEVLGVPPFTTQTGVGWLVVAGAYGVILLGAALILTLQYAQRRTPLARVMVALAVVVSLGILYVPFKPVFAVQQRISRSYTNPPQLEADFLPARPHADLASRVPTNTSVDSLLRHRAVARFLDKTSATLLLPMHVAGLHRDGILLADLATLRLIGKNGTLLYEGAEVCARNPNGIGSACLLNELEVHSPPDAADASIDVVQVLRVPREIYDRIKDQWLHVEIDYALTSFEARPPAIIGTVEGPRRLPGMGRCATRIDDDGDDLTLTCMTTTTMPPCITAVLRDPHTGLHNPEMHQCEAHYDPLALDHYADVLGRFGMGMPFSDRTHLIQFPVDATRIQNAQLAITTYEPLDHFTRKLVIDPIRLSDWRIELKHAAAALPAGFYRHMN